MADAAGDEADEHLAGSRLGQLDLLDDERPAELLENRSADFHGRSLAQRGAGCAPALKRLWLFGISRRATRP